ncbi:MAG: SemiSWEET transporter [Fibrobacter sp.]|nr:SemiSWEET transporter [Fibrobacter sp.]
MKLEILIGLMGGALTTISFLPQVIKVWRTHSTKDLSLIMFLLFSLGVLLWLIYGLILMDWPIIISNLVTLLLALTILAHKVRYK